ncbi:PREDICTED: uncharacterized protein LOC106821627 [Priapulus caudatus]|uniref:Uncharacterized protein LOC106821627 n=1 Tax=Priapulus caudatus TaxID=37621 RepID=A0ABM1FC33_PRICU|nr:PREDICTED: uncharacterized protein LOC106821627 [Priapulus caudatus]
MRLCIVFILVCLCGMAVAVAMRPWLGPNKNRETETDRGSEVQHHETSHRRQSRYHWVMNLNNMDKGAGDGFEWPHAQSHHRGLRYRRDVSGFHDDGHDDGHEDGHDEVEWPHRDPSRHGLSHRRWGNNRRHDQYDDDDGYDGYHRRGLRRPRRMRVHNDQYNDQEYWSDEGPHDDTSRRSPGRRFRGHRQSHRQHPWTQIMNRIRQTRTQLGETFDGLYNDTWGMVFPDMDLIDVVNWWEDENVCVTRESLNETDSPDVTSSGNPGSVQVSMTSSRCEELDDVYRCTTRVSVYGLTKIYRIIYQCCPGYEHQPGADGCIQMLELKSVEEVATDLGLTNFVEVLGHLELSDMLVNENVTLFAPTNEAIQEFHAMERLQTVDEKEEEGQADTHAILKGHVVTGVVRSSGMADEQTILTEAGHKLRVNIYRSRSGSRLLLANCVRVTSVDNMAVNGVVHVLEKVMAAPVLTIMDVISKDAQFSMLKSWVSQTDLVQGSATMTDSGPY